MLLDVSALLLEVALVGLARAAIARPSALSTLASTTISTRLFAARAALLLPARRGRVSAYPVAEIRPTGILGVRKRSTPVARSVDSSQLLGYRLVLIGTESV